jgi:NitT/TauT family transport system ATP-binding protein
VTALPSPDTLVSTEQVDRPLIEMTHVSKRFGSGRRVTEAISNVTLAIRRSEFVSLIGPSGCGKTSLLNLAAGLSKADAGMAAYAGLPISGPNTRVGYLTQDDALLPWRTVAANVALPLEIKRISRRERRARVEEILERVGLSGFGRHLPSQLSGGMRKRVSLARCLVYQPETLLLDEPFGALDAQTRIVMQAELARLVAAAGLTVMLVTHDLNEAIALSDRIVVFSPRPARILDILAPECPRPPHALARRPGDDALYAQLWRLLSHDANELALVAAVN